VPAIVLYLLSYFFYRNNFYSRNFHRKLWNIILAIAFILTAFAGVFLALQINYKWDIQVTKVILKWHVEFGACLAITGVFHFLWHFAYYTKFAAEDDQTSEKNHPHTSYPPDLPLNLFLIGFISTSVQLLLLKEIMNISGGYELIAGAFLGSWLIGSAAGSHMAARSALSDQGKINLVFSVTPVVSLIMMIVLERLWLKTGETPSFLAGILYTFLVLIPFCFVSGFTFIKLISAAAKSGKFIPGESFSIETTGGIVSGILISLFVSGRLDTYKTLILIILFGISYVTLTFFLFRKSHKILFKAVILACAIGIILTSPDVIFRQLLLRGIKVLQSRDTQYGNITVGAYGGETSTYYNQRLLMYNYDAVEREEDIHYALLQHKKPEKILLVSGSLNSHLQELIKYPVSEIHYVERDPALTKTGIGPVITGNVKLKVENNDAFRFVRRTDEKFDVAIVLLPPPSSLLLNKYYTSDFFVSVKKILNPGGIFACSPGINPGYFNKESVTYYSSIFNTLKTVFGNILPVGGTKLYFIASDSLLSSSFCRLVGEKKIETLYVGPDYLSDDLIKAKSDEIKSLIDPEVKINRSAVPVACFYYQSFSLSKNTNERIPALILLLVMFGLPVIYIKRDNLIMYFSASALAGFEITLLLVLQLTAGNMYQLTGLIIAGIMAGLAAGSGLKTRISSSGINVAVILLAAFYILAGFLAGSLIESHPGRGLIALLILAGLIPSFATGLIFREMTSVNDYDSAASSVYYADLAGSAIGFIVFSGLIIPFLGIKLSLLILPVMIVAGLLISHKH